MEGIVNIFAFCVCCGVMILCVVLIIYGVLRFIRHSATRDTRLYILSGIAFFILLFMFSRYYINYLEGSDGDENRNGTVITELLSGNQGNSETFDFSMVTDGCLIITKTVIGSLIFVVAFASAVTLLFIVILCIYYGLRTIIQGDPNPNPNPDPNSNPKTKKSIGDKFANAIKQRIVILVITLGVLSFFFILPILFGEQSGGDLIETWIDGIVKIDSLFTFNVAEGDKEGTDTTDQGNKEGADTKDQGNKEGTDTTDQGNKEGADTKDQGNKEGTDTTNQGNKEGVDTKDQGNKEGADTKDQRNHMFVTYILVYIIVIGVGFAVIKLLLAVFEHELLKKEKLDLIDKYSSPIALLSVGVAFLLALKKGKIPAETGIETIWELLKAFGTVVFIIAIVILALEIVRLLMDIRQKLIRQEAKYLFISLVGQSTLLVLGALNFIYSVVCSMIDAAEGTDLDKFEGKLRNMIVEKMEQQRDCVDVDDEDGGHGGNYRTSFSMFDEKVTKK